MSVAEFYAVEYQNSIFGSPSLASLLEDDDFPTDTLVNLANDIAKGNMEVIIREKNEVKLSLGKLLLALLQNASTDTPPNEVSGLRYTASVIYIAQKEERLEETAKFYLDFMLYPMRCFRAALTPAPSLANDEPTTEPEKRNDIFWKQLMVREDYRCAINRTHVDFYHRPASMTDEDDVVHILRGCHIIPFSLHSFTQDQIRNTTTTWTLIKNWTNCEIRDLIEGGINHPSNGILMNSDCHAAFATFMIYFVALDEEPDTYEVYFWHDDVTPKGVVRFVSRGDIPVPSPELIKVHAAFARVLYASGARDYFEQLSRDHEVGVLARDGSGANLLHYALQSLSAK